MDSYDPATRTGEQLDLPGILEEASDIVHGERQEDYGHPSMDFDRQSRLLNTLGFRRLHLIHSGDTVDVSQRKLEPADIPEIQICVKLSRIYESPNKRDHWVDIAGYAATRELLGFDNPPEDEDADE